MGVIMITHDLGVVAESCDRVVVMYAGRKVEEATVLELFDRPRHPYTRALMASMPALSTARRAPRPRSPAWCRRRTSSAAAAPSRRAAPIAEARCRVERPAFVVDGGGHGVACFAAEEGRIPEPCRSSSRRHERARPLLAVEKLRKHYVSPKPLARQGAGRRSRRSTTSPSPSSAARRWRWSANRAAARRRPPSRWCAWSSRPPARCSLEGEELTTLSAERDAPAPARTCRSSSRTRTPRSTRACRPARSSPSRCATSPA